MSLFFFSLSLISCFRLIEHALKQSAHIQDLDRLDDYTKISLYKGQIRHIMENALTYSMYPVSWMNPNTTVKSRDLRGRGLKLRRPRPDEVVAMAGIAKVYATELIDLALQVQHEWQHHTLHKPSTTTTTNTTTSTTTSSTTSTIRVEGLRPEHLREAKRRYDAKYPERRFPSSSAFLKHARLL